MTLEFEHFQLFFPQISYYTISAPLENTKSSSFYPNKPSRGNADNLATAPESSPHCCKWS